MNGDPTTDTFTIEPPEARLLDGRKAPVTGADSGIGRGIAYRLAAHGASVAINHLDDATTAEAMAEQIRDAGGRALTVRMDGC